MFKRIPGNRNYRINLNGEIVDYIGTIINCDLKDGTVKVEMFGKMVALNKRALAIYSHYEIADIFDVQSHIDKVMLCRCDSNILRVKCGYIMVFNDPIEYIDGFRIIPCFSRYAINKHGVIIDTKSNEVVDKLMVDYDGYSCAYIYNPDRNVNRWTKIHRLVALAWIKNTDFITRPYVNHLDGNKTNYSISNLEWCTLSENCKHAVDIGLNPSSVALKTRDISTGEIEHYSSGSELRKRLGLNNVNAESWIYKMPGFLINRRYEIKLVNDDTPWFYEKNKVEPSKAIFTISVTDNETAEIKTFIRVIDFVKAYGLKSKTNNLEDYVEEFKKLYLNHSISYKRNSVIGPYKVFDIHGKHHDTFTSIIGVGNFIGITRTELQYDLCRSRKFIYNKKWIVIPEGSDAKIDDYTLKKSSIHRVVVKNICTHTEIEFESAAAASMLIPVSYRTIIANLNSGKNIKGYTFRTLD